MQVLQANVKFHRDIRTQNNKRTEERATEMVNIWINTVAYFTPTSSLRYVGQLEEIVSSIERLRRCNT